MIRTIAIALTLTLAACVTPGDIARIGLDVDSLRATWADDTATFEDVGEQLDNLSATVDQVVVDATARADGFITAGEAAGGGSVAIALALAALNRWRNSQRRRRGEPVNVPDSTAAA